MAISGAGSFSRLTTAFFSAADRPPCSQAIGTPSGASHSLNLRRCCSARISVGAITAAWQPASIAARQAMAATMVLPLPTSPCSRRCIGCGCARSRRICAMARPCARVSRNGSLPRKRLSSGPFDGQRQRLARAPRPVRHAHRELLREQFVELDAPPGRTAALCERRGGGRAPARGQVQRAHARREFRQVVALAHRRGQRVVEVDLLQRGQHELAQLRLRQARRGRDRPASAIAAAARRARRCGSAGAPSPRRKSPGGLRRRRAPAAPRSAARWNCLSWLP